jgi:ribosomal protein L15
MQDLKATIDRSKVEQDQLKMSATTEQEVAIVKAEQVGNVLITQVEGEKAIIESQVQAKVVEMVNKASAQAQAKITDTKQQAEVQQI